MLIWDELSLVVGLGTFFVALNLVVRPGHPTLLVGFLMLNFLTTCHDPLALTGLDPLSWLAWAGLDLAALADFDLHEWIALLASNWLG